MKIFLPLFFILLVSGCNQNNSSIEPESQNTIDTTAFTNNLQVPNVEVRLLPQVKEITDNWLAFITAQIEIENFNSYTVNDVIPNATPIAEIMFSLQQTVPESFRTNAVETRLSVLYTKAKVLERQTKKRNIDPREIAATAEEIPVEFNNFKIQLNELFLKTLEEFEEELDSFDEDEEAENTFLPRQETVKSTEERDTIN